MPDAPILSARGLGLAYGSIVALHGVEFDLPPVGVKVLAKPPDMVARLDENLALC